MLILRGAALEKGGIHGSGDHRRGWKRVGRSEGKGLGTEAGSPASPVLHSGPWSCTGIRQLSSPDDRV